MRKNSEMIRRYVLTVENLEKLNFMYRKITKLARLSYEVRNNKGGYYYDLLMRVSDVHEKVMNAYHETLTAYRKTYQSLTGYTFGL